MKSRARGIEKGDDAMLRITGVVLIVIAVLASGGIGRADDERSLRDSIALMQGAKQTYCTPQRGKKRTVCETEHDLLIKRLELCLEELKLRGLEVNDTMTTVYKQDLLLVQIQSKYLGQRYFVPKQSSELKK